MKNIKSYEDFTNEEINLKKTLVGAVLGAGLALPVKGQISSTKIDPIKTEITTSPYDSTQNFIKELYTLVGQDFYLRKDVGSSKYTSSVQVHDGFYKSLNDVKKYKQMKLFMGGEYFKLLDIDTLETIKVIDKVKVQYLLKFERKSTKDIVYFDLRHKDNFNIRNTPSVYSFPFIVVGFYEKQKSLCIGSRLTIDHLSYGDIDNYGNEEKIGTPHSVYLKKDDKVLAYKNLILKSEFWISSDTSELSGEWECVDLSINENDNKLSLFFKKGEQTAIIPFELLFGDINTIKYNKSSVTKP
jgi:hypothetical protein